MFDPAVVRLKLEPYFSGEESGGEQRMFCPLCEEPGVSRTPSASINPEQGVWNCLKTEEHGGEVLDLVQDLRKGGTLSGPAPQSRRVPAGSRDLKPVLPPKLEDQDKPLVDWPDQLNLSPKLLKYLMEQRGLNRDTIARFHIGHDGDRYTIPIQTLMAGGVRNVRRYKPGASVTNKMLNIPGHGTNMLAFGGTLSGNSLPVIVAEGEWDALLTNQEMAGRAVSITGTGGAKSVPSDLSAVANRELFVAYDCDEAGRTGAEKFAAAARKVGAIVYVLDLSRLGLPADSGEDLSDFFHKRGGTREKLLAEMERLRLEGDFDAEAERESKVEEQAEWLRVQRDARSRLAAEGWEPPPAQGSWAKQMNEPDEPINWLIPDLAFEGANVVVNAQAKSGKTSLILNVAHSLLSGDPLFGHFDVRALPADRSIAWWNAELNERQAKAWLREFDLPRAQDFHPAHLRGFAMPLDVEQVEFWAVEWLRERRVSVWLIDPLSALFTGEENSNTELGAWLSAIDRIKRRAGVETAFLVHHVSETGAPEEGDDPNSGRLLKGRGASRLSGWADVLWSYSGRFDEPRYLAALGRDVDLPPFGGLHMAPGSRLLRWSGTRSTPAQDRRNSLALAAFDKVTENCEPMKAGDLQSALPGKKPDTKRRAIQFAVLQGWLTAKPGPQNSTLYTPGEVDPRHMKLGAVRSAN